MAEWKEKIDLSDLWSAYDDGTLPLSNLVTQFANRFRTTSLFKRDEQAREVIEQLETDAASTGFDIEDFDDHLDKIYDLADINSRLWIGTVQKMRYIIWWLRSCFCKHQWKLEEERRKVVDSEGFVYRSGLCVSATCTVCGWHRAYWKHLKV